LATGHIDETDRGIHRTMEDQPTFSRIVLEADEVLFDEGDEGDAAYIIVRGEVEISKGSGTLYPKILAAVGRGEIFGEMALFDNRPRMARAVAKCETELICISHEEFKSRLRTIDPVMRNMVNFLVLRVRSMADEFMRTKKQ